MRPLYLLLGISITFVIIIFIASIILFRNSENRQTNENTVPTPVSNQDESSGFGPAADFPDQPPPRTNPTYLQKIEEQPFWEMLPYYGETFLVEYKSSDEKIVITTIDPGRVSNREELILQYRQQARNWLTQNGAILNQLTIEYVISSP